MEKIISLKAPCQWKNCRWKKSLRPTMLYYFNNLESSFLAFSLSSTTAKCIAPELLDIVCLPFGAWQEVFILIKAWPLENGHERCISPPKKTVFVQTNGTAWMKRILPPLFSHILCGSWKSNKLCCYELYLQMNLAAHQGEVNNQADFVYTPSSFFPLRAPFAVLVIKCDTTSTSTL